jgi:hypothetical protein
MTKDISQVVEEQINVLSNLLHEYMQDCEEDPMGGQPLARLGRKRMYAERIIAYVVEAERTRLREAVEGMKWRIELKEGAPERDLGTEQEIWNDALSEVLTLLNPDAEAKKHLNDIMSDPAHIRKAAEEGSADQNALHTPKTSCCPECDNYVERVDTNVRVPYCMNSYCPCHTKLADTEV